METKNEVTKTLSINTSIPAHKIATEITDFLAQIIGDLMIHWKGEIAEDGTEIEPGVLAAFLTDQFIPDSIRPQFAKMVAIAALNSLAETI